jgi:hypothetical protein
MKNDVEFAFTNNISSNNGLMKCWLETLPAPLGRITVRGADRMASCKLLEKFLYLHTQREFINELFSFMQTNDLSKHQLWYVPMSPAISR